MTYGGYFETAATQGSGVRGIASASTGETYGVYGRSYSTSDNARGVYGRSYASSGVTYGVVGTSDSDEGVGVYGRASASAGLYAYGVFGKSNTVNGTGVRGEGNNGVRGEGVIGVAGAGEDAGGSFDDTNSSGWGYVGFSTYKVYGSGGVSFVQNHPSQEDRVVVYTAPEGDEVATYTRGTARLVNGEARVSLGETFKWVTNPAIGLTAHLTPHGEPVPLAVVSLTTEELVVRGPKDGSDVTFDYIVYGLRIGFEEVSIVQEKEREAYIPAMTSHRERYASHPDLRKYNALERFKEMHATLEAPSTFDLSPAHALRDAIEEYDPAVHGPVAEREWMHEMVGTEEDLREQMESSELADDEASPGVAR